MIMNLRVVLESPRQFVVGHQLLAGCSSICWLAVSLLTGGRCRSVGVKINGSGGDIGQ